MCPRFPQESSVTLWIELLHLERGGRQGGRELQGSVMSVDCSPQSSLFPPGAAAKYSPFVSHIKYKLRMGDLIVRIMVTLL